jgi:DNA repair protein RadC
VELLAVLVGDSAARKVSAAPGGWRTLSPGELEGLGLRPRLKTRVEALQKLTAQGFAELVPGTFASFMSVARAYRQRLEGLEHEVVLAVALNGQNRVLGEFEVSKGGRHGAALTVADVFRPLIRAGASAGLLIHNHPSGDPAPSPEDRLVTKVVKQAGDLIGIPLLDHVIVGARGGGCVSLRELSDIWDEP